MAAKQPLGSVVTTPTTSESPGYETMCECYPQLVALIQQSPSTIGNALFSRNFLAPSVRNFVHDRMVSETEKAQKLVDTMTDRIQHFPSSFNDFVEILKKEGPWTSEMVKELRHLYRAKSGCAVEEDQYSPIASSDDSFQSASELDGSFHVDAVSVATHNISIPSTGDRSTSATTKTRSKSSSDDAGTQTSDSVQPDSSQATTSSVAGFVCPFCKQCTVEEFFSKNGCPKAVSCVTEQQPMFPYLNTKMLSEKDRRELESRLACEMGDMTCLFARFRSSIIESFESYDVEVERVVDYVLSLSLASVGPKALAQKDEENLRKAKSILNVFSALLPYTSFFHYRIIEVLVDKFIPQDGEKLEQYISAFNRFCKRSVFEVPPNVFRCAIEKRDDRVFSIKYVTEATHSLGDIVVVHRKIAEVLGVSSWALQLCSIKEGCVCLQFSIASCVADEVLPVSQSQQAALNDIGIRVLEQADDTQTGEAQSEKPRYIVLCS